MPGSARAASAGSPSCGPSARISRLWRSAATSTPGCPSSPTPARPRCDRAGSRRPAAARSRAGGGRRAPDRALRARAGTGCARARGTRRGRVRARGREGDLRRGCVRLPDRRAGSRPRARRELPHAARGPLRSDRPGGPRACAPGSACPTARRGSPIGCAGSATTPRPSDEGWRRGSSRQGRRRCCSRPRRWRGGRWARERTRLPRRRRPRRSRAADRTGARADRQPRT